MAEPKKEGGGFMGGLASFGSSMMSSLTELVAPSAQDLEVQNPDGSKSKGGDKEPEGEKKELMQQLVSYIGKDVMSVLSLPIWLMEPTTLLMKIAEIMEYRTLLDDASKADEAERLALIAAFCCSVYAANDRVKKPFNPVLGETFQMRLPAVEPSESGGRGGGSAASFLAEQVSHHPPIACVAARSDDGTWDYEMTSCPRTRFLGNSVEVVPVGRTRIRINGEAYVLLPPMSKVHNILLGSTWVDNYGKLVVEGATSGMRCELTLAECGWFGGMYAVEGHVLDKDGKFLLRIDGAWNDTLSYAACDPATGAAVADAPKTKMWTATPKPDPKTMGDLGKYNFSTFARQMFTPDGPSAPAAGAVLSSGLPVLASDARRRTDREALERGDTSTAGTEKGNIEETQRAEARLRPSGTKFQARWFRDVEKPEAEVPNSMAVARANEPGADDLALYNFRGVWPSALCANSAFPKAPESLEAGSETTCASGGDFSPWEFEGVHKAKA